MLHGRREATYGDAAKSHGPHKPKVSLERKIANCIRSNVYFLAINFLGA